MTARVLVAGVGNIFLSDDGFGVEVARRLAGETLPAGVTVGEFGIRGMHLAYELLEGYDTLVLIDAAARGEPPGTVFVLERDVNRTGGSERGDGFVADAHSMDPEVVLATLENLGGRLERVIIIGCEPQSTAEGIGLTPVVEAAIETAVRATREAIELLLRPNDDERTSASEKEMTAHSAEGGQ